jgi:hypothetical protein
MNDMISIIGEILLFIIEVAIVSIIFYFVASRILSKKKYNGVNKGRKTVFLSSVICFLFFLVYGLVDNYLDFKVRLLAPLWFFFFPLSVVIILVYGFLLIFKKRF